MEADERGNEREKKNRGKKERKHPYELMKVCLLRAKCPKSQIF